MNTFRVVEKKDELEYNKWVDHLTNTKERINYSIRRMDLLIITIAGAGIYIIFESLRELNSGDIKSDDQGLLLWSGIFLLIATITNFVSQVTGYHANTNEEHYILQELRRIEKSDFDECEQKRFDRKSTLYDKWTKWLNNASIIFMFVGLILLAIFNYLLF